MIASAASVSVVGTAMDVLSLGHLWSPVTSASVSVSPEGPILSAGGH